VRARRAAEAFTPDGLRDRWQALGVGARLFRDEVATGKAAAEPRLRERLTGQLSSTLDPTRQLEAGGTDAVPELEPSEPSESRKEGKQ
jgi:hypothetical protein